MRDGGLSAGILAANGMLLASLRPKLLEAVNSDDHPNLAKFNVCASLQAASAKIWIREGSSMLNGDRDLEVEPWVSEAQNGVELAKLGLTTPKVSKYEIKGALLDPFGNERVPVRKVGRHFDIHRYGFS